MKKEHIFFKQEQVASPKFWMAVGDQVSHTNYSAGFKTNKKYSLICDFQYIGSEHLRQGNIQAQGKI